MRSELPKDINHNHSITSGERNEMTTNAEIVWAREQSSLERYINNDASSWYYLFLVMTLFQPQSARKVLLKARSSKPSPEEKL